MRHYVNEPYGSTSLGDLSAMVRASGYDEHRDVGTVWSVVSSKMATRDKLEAGIALFSEKRGSRYVLISGVNLANSWWTRVWSNSDPLALINSCLLGVAIDSALGIGAHGSGIEEDMQDVFRSKLPAWLKAGVLLNRT